MTHWRVNTFWRLNYGTNWKIKVFEVRMLSLKMQYIPSTPHSQRHWSGNHGVTSIFFFCHGLGIYVLVVLVPRKKWENILIHLWNWTLMLPWSFGVFHATVNCLSIGKERDQCTGWVDWSQLQMKNCVKGKKDYLWNPGNLLPPPQHSLDPCSQSMKNWDNTMKIGSPNI